MKINRLTKTVGFITTLSNHVSFNTQLIPSNGYCSFVIRNDEGEMFMQLTLDKKEVSILRDFFGHTFDYMEDNDE